MAKTAAEGAKTFRTGLAKPVVTLVIASVSVLLMSFGLAAIGIGWDDIASKISVILIIMIILALAISIFGVLATAPCTNWWPAAWTWFLGSYGILTEVVVLFAIIIHAKHKPTAQQIDDCRRDNDTHDEVQLCLDLLHDWHNFAMKFQEDGDFLWSFWTVFSLLILFYVWVCVIATMYWIYALKDRHAENDRACCRSCCCYDKNHCCYRGEADGTKLPRDDAPAEGAEGADEEAEAADDAAPADGADPEAGDAAPAEAPAEGEAAAA